MPELTYEQAVAREARLRRLGYLQLAEPLFGLPQVALTWRHVIELGLAGNAYFHGREPVEEDQWLFLWRLHPFFTRPDGTRPNLLRWSQSQGQHRPARLASLKARWRVARVSLSLDVLAAQRSIHQRILDAYLDAEKPDSGSGAGSSLSARLHWFDHFAQYYTSKGASLDEVLDMGVSRCFQLKRAYYIGIGEADRRCIPPSAALKRFED